MILKKAQRVRKSMKTRCRRNPVYSDVSICEDYLKAKKAHVKYMVTESPYAALLAPKVVSAILAWDRF